MKNHVNGLGFADGKIMVTPHGFMKAKESAEEKISIQEYAKENLDYISKLFGEKVADISELGFKVETSSEDDE
jgi:hypothetical protein